MGDGRAGQAGPRQGPARGYGRCARRRPPQRYERFRPEDGFLETNLQHPLYRYAKRAYVIIGKSGVVRYKKVLDNARELVTDDELLAELDKLK